MFLWNLAVVIVYAISIAKLQGMQVCCAGDVGVGWVLRSLRIENTHAGSMRVAECQLAATNCVAPP